MIAVEKKIDGIWYIQGRFRDVGKAGDALVACSKYAEDVRLIEEEEMVKIETKEHFDFDEEYEIKVVTDDAEIMSLIKRYCDRIVRYYEIDGSE